MINKSTYELLMPVIAAIDRVFKIDSIVDNGSFSYTLFSCNTLWATKGFPVIIDGNDYVISDMEPNESITVDGRAAVNVFSFELYPPIFYHGTIKATQYDLTKKINGTLLTADRLPMIWLHEPTDETINEDPLRAILMTSNCELYFMNDADFAAWDNDDHYKYAIKPMRNLVQSFMSAIRKCTYINDNIIKTSALKDFARWGVYLGKDGGEKTIFSRPMSGTRFDVEIPFIRNNKACC